MKRPLIAIMPSRYGGSFGVGKGYLDAIFDAGGLGVILPYTDDDRRIAELALLFDGFLFAGGGDVDPGYYGEHVSSDGLEIDNERDLFEYKMFHEIFPMRKPILGICRGIQVLNVFLGGSLYQHIEGHMQKKREEREQSVTISPDGLLYSIVGTEKIKTNSFHHQSIKTLGEHLFCNAVSSDGCVEAIHHTGHRFFLGLQWHPELYYKKDPAMRRVFEEFVRAAYRTAEE